MTGDLRKMQALKARTLAPGKPPKREETFETLEGPRKGDERDKAAGRNTQFNVRVAEWYRKRVRQLSDREHATLGEVCEAMLAAYEASGGDLSPGLVPVEDARRKRTNEVRFYATEWVRGSIGRIAADRGLSVSELMEDLLAREAQRLDPQGGKFGVYVKRG